MCVLRLLQSLVFFLIVGEFASTTSVCRDLNPVANECKVKPGEKCKVYKAVDCPKSCNQCHLSRYLGMVGRKPCRDRFESSRNYRRCSADITCSNRGYAHCRRTCNDCHGRKYQRYAHRVFNGECVNFYPDEACRITKENNGFRSYDHELKCRKTLGLC